MSLILQKTFLKFLYNAHLKTYACTKLERKKTKCIKSKIPGHQEYYYKEKDWKYFTGREEIYYKNKIVFFQDIMGSIIK